MSNVFHNRIIGTGEENPESLLANPGNWRVHPKHQQQALEGVLREVGYVQQVIVNQRTGHLVDGHLRVSLALRNEEQAIPVLYVDLSENEERLVLATLDPLAGMAATDKEQLDALMREISAGDAAVQALVDEIAQAEGIVLGRDEDDEGGPGGEGGGHDPGNPVIQYNIVFDTEDQQADFHAFIRYLKKQYPDCDTLGERLAQFIQEGGFQE